MITHIFFSFSILALLFEMKVLLNPNKAHKFITDYEHDHDSTNLSPIFYSSKHLNFTILMLLYSLWTIIGLCTKQWFFFGILLLLGTLNYKNKSVEYKIVDSLISILVIVVMLVDQYKIF